LQIGRIFGPNLIGRAFYCKYGDPCGSKGLTFQAKAGCNGVITTPTQFWDLSGVLLTNVAMTVNAQDMLIQERVGAMFVELKLRTQPDEVPDPCGRNAAAAAAAVAAAGAVGAVNP